MEMELTKREKNIVDILKNHEYLKAGSIAKQLQISEKTVRVTIADINARSDQPVILSLKGKGYQLNPVIRMEDTSISLAEGDARQLSILCHILAGGGAEYYGLADQFFISESTLEKDITVINAEIRKRFPHLLIKRKQNRLFLDGSEEEKRSILFNFLMKELEEYSFDFVCIAHYFLQCDVISVKDTVLEFIRKEKILLKDIEIIYLILYASIIIERVKSSHLIVKPVGILDKNSRSYRLCTRLELDNEVLLPEPEMGFICLLFKDKLELDVPVQKEAKDDMGFLGEVLEEIYDKYNIDLRSDEEFRQNLMMHLMDLYHRAKTGQYISNPLVGDIKRAYPLIYDISVYLAIKVQEHFGVRLHEDEIGYISLHIGSTMNRKYTKRKRIAIISPNRNAVSSFIENTLYQHLGHMADILGTYSLFSGDEIRVLKPDLIVTTTPVQESYSCPVFQCSNLITHQEIHKIKQILANQEFGDLENRLQLLHQFDDRLFYPLLELHSKEEVIHFLCNRLAELGYCDGQYETFVLERESIASTSFGNYIAIPHPVEMAALKSGIAVATLKNDVQWGENKVRIVFLFALSRQIMNLSLFYQVIAKSIDNGSRMKELAKYTTFHSFIEQFLN